MKYASAMKYGGELVDAVDCDYDSFKELIPLCPNCKEPVFLRTGGPRESVKGKAYQIGPHWCHFKGISAEQVAGCELRVNGYTEKDRAKIAAQARGQRLKLLQRWFMTVLRNHPLWWNVGALFDKVASDQGWSKQEVNALMDIKSLTVVNNKAVIHEFIDKKFSNPVNNEKLPELVTVFNEALSQIKLNKQICHEVIDFLCSKSARPLLDVCIKTSCTEDSSAFSGFGLQTDDYWILGMATRLMYIPWASEFQRLEAEARQRKGAA